MDPGGMNEEFISFYPSAFTQSSRCALGTPVLDAVERPTSICSDSSYISLPTNIGNSSLVTFGCHFENSCKVPHNANFANGQSANKPVDCGDAHSWYKEIAFHQAYPGSYPGIPAFIDLPAVQKAMMGDPRHETYLTMEGHQPWDWSKNCSRQLYCPQDQTQSPHIWKPSLTEGAAFSFSQRGKKKRVPYTKLQLKELEREYNNTKFITKERRRRIASSTNLSERQVTIWFQNRRVKQKKIPTVCK